MNNQLSYPTFLSIIVYFLFISHLMVNVTPYWGMDVDSEMIELTNSEDSESEEEDKKEERKDEIRASQYASDFEAMKSYLCLLHSREHFSHHYPEIVTPPPKFV